VNSEVYGLTSEALFSCAGFMLNSRQSIMLCSTRLIGSHSFRIFTTPLRNDYQYFCNLR